MATAVLNIDVEQLKSELAGTRLRFDSWHHELSHTLRKLSTEQVNKLNETKLTLHNLTARQEVLQEQARGIHNRLAAERSQVQQLEQQLQALQEQQHALPKRVDQLTTLLEQKEAQLSGRERALLSDKQAVSKGLAALQKAADIFQQRLGLTFQQPVDGSEELQLVFTQVDARDPSRPFMFAVHVLDDNTYKVTRCEPAVPRLPTLLQQLNSSGNFSAFAKAMRREFQQHAAQALPQ